MSKKFYGVYGFNGGGIYDNWSKVESTKKFVKGIKFKGFHSKKEAVEFIINGVTNEYGLGEIENIDQEALYSHTNFFIYLQDLFVSNIPKSNDPYQQSDDVFEIIGNIKSDLQNLEMLLMSNQTNKKTEAIKIFRWVKDEQLD